MNLRETLQGAINSREATLRNGTCRRLDFGNIHVSIGKAQSFLASYPNADDQRVKQWCFDHMGDVLRIVPANQTQVIAKLLSHDLERTGNDIVQLSPSLHQEDQNSNLRA